MKIDPRTGEPLGKTIFCAYLKSKNSPSGLGIDTVDSGVEDSMLMGGGSAYGLIEPTGKGGIAISGSCRTTLQALGIDSTPTPVTIDFWPPGR